MLDTATPETTTAERQTSERSKANYAATAAALLFVSLVIFAAYSPILFNWFAGDDFVHLAWLRDAVHQPELIWRNFHSSWLDLTNTKFYRPLISVFMVTDYLTWGTNGFGFHLTNVIFLLISSVSLFFIMGNLLRVAPNLRYRSSAFVSALLFGIYPLHPEPVSWITGRVDAIVTAFSLLSIWFYMQWRQTKRGMPLALCWVCMGLGLLSKEMALTLPAVFLAYDLLIGSEHSRMKLLDKGIQAVKNTLPFWATLVVYFGIRRIALGTFVGGYDNSLFFISDVKNFVLGWVHALHMMLVPANRELMGAHNIFVILWQAGLVASIALAGWQCAKNSFVARRALFLLSWLAISLAPVYKIFAISDDLQGSRLAYLATAPLVCLIALSMASEYKQSARKSFVPLASVIASLLLFVSGFYMLEKNNSAWAEAGSTSNAIRARLQQFYSAITDDPQVLLVGLPDTINGAYVVRNGLPGMTKSPQLCRDIKNALMVNTLEPVLPLGYCKTSISENGDKVTVLAWHQDERRFHMISMRAYKSAFQPGATAFKQSMMPGNGSHLKNLANGAVEVVANDARQHPVITLNVTPELSCFNTNFIAVRANVIKSGDGSGVDLFYKNNNVREFDLHHRVHVDQSTTGETEWLFALRSLPEWTLGSYGELQLRLPPGSDIQIESIQSINPHTLMPSISFANSGFMGTKGFAHLSSTDDQFQLGYDTESVPGAASVGLEITRPNLYFEEDKQNTADKSKVVMTRLICPLKKGTIKIERKLFPEAGLYELRPYALDRQGARLGVSGDHIVIAVDS